LQVLDVLGREIDVLVNREMKPGVYEVEWDAANVPNGIYFYTLRTSDFSDTRKMILVK
jgi:hypothetical protein